MTEEKKKKGEDEMTNKTGEERREGSGPKGGKEKEGKKERGGKHMGDTSLPAIISLPARLRGTLFFAPSFSSRGMPLCAVCLYPSVFTRATFQEVDLSLLLAHQPLISPQHLSL